MSKSRSSLWTTSPCRLILTALILLGQMLVSTRPVTAQVLYGTLVGNVTDASRGAVPEAVVVIQYSATGISRQVFTSDVAKYTFPYVPIGAYGVTVSREEFDAVRRDVNISAGQMLESTCHLISVRSRIK
jgi:hypothetical protein